MNGLNVLFSVMDDDDAMSSTEIVSYKEME